MTDSTEKEREEAAEINQEVEWQPQNPGIFFHTNNGPSYL